MAKILVAEDSGSVREFVARALTHDGHAVRTVDNGVEALAAIAREHFDLLLADIVMPELDGIALSLKVSKEHPDLPILLMTGYAHERQRAHNLNALIHEVVAKPFTLKEICEAANRVLAKHPPRGDE